MKIPASARTSFAALAMLAVGTTACSDSTSPPPTAQIRFLHAAPGVDAVDFRVDDAGVLTGVEFGDDMSEYGSVPAGSRVVAARLVGESEDLVGPTKELASGSQYTAVLLNGFDSQLLAVYSDTNTAAAAGKTRLRVAKLSQLTGLLDVYVTATDAELDDAEPVFTELETAEASKYLEVPSGEQRIRFAEAGTKTVVFDLESIELPDAGVRTVFLVGTGDSDAPIRAIVIEDR